MTYGAVVQEDTLCHLHGFGILREVWNRHFLVLGKDRREAVFRVGHFLFPLALLGPAQYACVVAQAWVEHQIAKGKYDGQDKELKPPLRKRVVILFNAVSRVASGFDIAISIWGFVGPAVG